MTKSWLFYIFAQPRLNTDDLDWPTTQSVFDSYMEMCVRNEALGFEGVFFSEHHFSPILSPSPHLLLAAVAQRTSRLRLGVMGSVLPLHDVRRLAEECGMLDYLSAGRLEIGIGPGAGVNEALLAGLQADDIRPRYKSGAELLVKYLTGKRVTHCDEFYNLKDVPIVPPMRQSDPRVWVTAMSPSSAAWAAQQGFNVCTAWMPTAGVAEAFSIYRQAAADAGRTADPSKLGVRRRVFVARTDAEAQELADAAVDPILAGIQHDLGISFEAADPAVMEMFLNPDDIIIGSPETVTERLVDQVRETGAGHVLFATDFKLFTSEDSARSHELIAKEVMPVLESLSVGEPAAQGAI